MNKNSIEFEKAQNVDNIRATIKNIFDLDLDISGSWGYDQKSALKINKINTSFEQFAHTFAIIRSNIEMNIMLEESSRYNGLNAHIENKKEFTKDNIKYKIVSLKITATPIEQNNKLIKEYKENYGKENFDMTEHFQKRKECEISRTIECWFDITNI